MENLSPTIEGYPDNTVPFNEWNSGYEVLSKEDLITWVCKDLKIVLFGIHNRMQQSLFISGTRHDVLTGIIEIGTYILKGGRSSDVTTVVDGKRRVQKRLSYECIRQHIVNSFMVDDFKISMCVMLCPWSRVNMPLTWMASTKMKR